MKKHLIFIFRGFLMFSLIGMSMAGLSAGAILAIYGILAIQPFLAQHRHVIAWVVGVPSFFFICWWIGAYIHATENHPDDGTDD